MKKTSKKTKSKKQTHPRAKVRKFESHYLALALVAFLLVEGFLGTTAHAADWKAGVSVLDISSPVQQTSSDLSAMFSPIGDTYLGVEEFYNVASVSMAELLDFSENSPIDDVVLVVTAISDFYQEASNEMVALLDSSSTSSWPAQVAGVSIEVQ